MRKVRIVIKEFSDRLKKANVFFPEKDVLSLVAHALGVNDEQIAERLDDDLGAEALTKAESYIERREKREPLHRILGSLFFCGLKIHVEDGVFRPCPETELLVEIALSFLEKKNKEPIRILDLGTGTGCILLALLKALPNATGVGVDREEPILEVARKNAKENNLSDRASFQLSDWGQNIDEAFDLIICNPPAIPTQNISRFPPEMRDYNPLASLDGGKDGLLFYKAIVKDFERLAKAGAFGIFRAYSNWREASLFDAAGFPVQPAADYKGQAYCIIVMNEKRKRGWLWRTLRCLPLCHTNKRMN